MGKLNEALSSIGLIGPVLPFRGGIAQHTTMLHRSLSSKADLCTISFKRQYPRYLYPGKSDRDPEYQGYSEPGVMYVLDSLNPVTWTKACRILLARAPGLIIIVWCTFFGAPYLGFMARYFRKRGIRVMFLCHNVIDHEAAFWKVELSRRALSQGSSFLVHTVSEKARLDQLVPGAQVSIHPHPVYHQFPSAKKKLPHRGRIELLFFGFVRHYKGLDILLEAMKYLEKEDIFLTIAGEWWGGNTISRKLLSNDRLSARVEVIDRYVSEQEASEYFYRTDLVVLPYRSATGSGVIPLAYHYGKPVIASRTAGIEEVVVDGVSGRLVEPESPYALAEVIREFLNGSPDGMKEGVRRAAERMTWEGFAACVLDVIKSGRIG
jgi:glycosyltransferase involved in cell wall biosynthesis